MAKDFVLTDNMDKLRSDQTLDSSDRMKYRHFAVDTVNDIVYFCDRNPYRKGMHCYSSNRKLFSEGTTNVWHGEFSRRVSTDDKSDTLNDNYLLTIYRAPASHLHH